MYCRPDGVERRSFFSRSATHAESHMTCVGWMSHAWDMSWTHAGVGWMSHAWGDMTWRRTLGGLVGVPPCLSAMDHTGPVLVKRAAPKTARVFDNTSRRSGGGGGPACSAAAKRLARHSSCWPAGDVHVRWLVIRGCFARGGHGLARGVQLLPE